MPANCYRSEFSCGVQLIRGETEYKDPVKFITDLHGFITRSSVSYRDIEQFIYTHNTDRYDIGYKIEQYIVQNKLGTVVRSPRAPNPVHNSEAPNHHITVWVWTRDVKAFNDHCEALKKTVEKPKEKPASKPVEEAVAAVLQPPQQPNIFNKAGY